MAFGFPAFHTEHFSPRSKSNANLHGAVKETLAILTWPVNVESENQIIASTGFNFRSWGERILINFLPDNSISITSQCSLPSQCFDWGKNRDNVSKFLMVFINRI